ncbi:hypothetical protein [Hymenobacter radiodurans]|uniref:hypothetical protein n=1 Tax=Hymenobacter radiodurans TaxID=2496028 RepID=UPI001058EA25|nr:hypothetical protein [Hymenobacter radiodurans]
MGYNAATQSDDLTFAKIKEDPAKDYQRWLEHSTPFWMIGLPILIRRSMLALTGMFNTGVVLVDLEFVYRITSLNVNIAWCTAVLSMHISNPNGNFNRMTKKDRMAEYNRITKFFITNPTRRSTGEVIRNTIESIKRPLRPAKRDFFNNMGWNQYQDPERFDTGYIHNPNGDPIKSAFVICDLFLDSQNANRSVEFLYKEKEISKVFKQ